MLAVALTVWALVLLLMSDSRSATIGAALLAVLALFTKQTQIALPIAAIAWLTLSDRRRLFVFVSTFLPVSIGAVALLQWVTRGEFQEYSQHHRALIRCSRHSADSDHWAGPPLILGIIATVSVAQAN
jgi:hypothetical protein